MSTSRALQQGFFARKFGEDLWRNPYAPGTAEFDVWERGWCRQDSMLPPGSRKESAQRLAMQVKAAESGSDGESIPY